MLEPWNRSLRRRAHGRISPVYLQQQLPLSQARQDLPICNSLLHPNQAQLLHLNALVYHIYTYALAIFLLLLPFRSRTTHYARYLLAQKRPEMSFVARSVRKHGLRSCKMSCSQGPY